MLDVYLDESGYTGDDLINADQPMFVLASTVLPVAEAASAIQRYFGTTSPRELKHSALASRPNGQQRVIEFVSFAKESSAFAVEGWHKEFTLVTTIVDFWIEESMHRHGIDLYEKGRNLGLANLLYMGSRVLFSEGERRTHLSRYQVMTRERTRTSYDRFWGPIRQRYEEGDKGFREIFSSIIVANADLGFAHLADLPRNILSVLSSSLLAIAEHWKQVRGQQMRFIHDASKELAKVRWAWEALLSPNVPAQVVGYDRRKAVFPLNVAEVRFGDSKDYAALQLVDVLAGATAVVLRNRMEPDYRPSYARALEEAGVLKCVTGIIWPSTAVTPKELGTDGDNARDALKMISEILARAEESRAKREDR
jgi:hypothetical protein